MKMKRMFGKKKTKAKNPAIYDSKNMATIDESAADQEIPNNANSHSKKKQRNRKKHKSKQKNRQKIVEHQSLNSPTVAYQEHGGTKVTIRQRPGLINDQIVLNDPKPTCKIEERRIPGSESSSRTASSASSASQSLSTRRPWSLVESAHGQSLSDLTDEVEFAREFNNSSNDHYNLTAPTICTMPRGSSLGEEFGKNNHSRTFTLDFSFFRRFKRSSLSNGVPNNKRLSASQMILSQSTKERESFSIKNITKNRKSKKQNIEDIGKLSSSQPCLNSLESGGRRSLVSCSESLHPLQESVLEDTPSPLHSPKKTDWSSSETSSRASINTVIGAVDRHVKKQRHSTPKHYVGSNATQPDVPDGIISENRRCKKCQKLQTGYRRSVCYCVSIGSTDEQSFVLSKECTAQSETELNHPTSLRTSVTCHTTDSIVNFDQSKSFKSGGSMKNVRGSVETANSIDLDDEVLEDNGLQFQVLSPKNSAPYASSPQVNISEVANVPKKRTKASSVKIRFAEENAMFREFPQARPLQVVQSSTNISCAIESSLKTAIAYPEVVMRRRKQNRSLKNTSDSLVVKSSSSSGLLSREDRTKQVLSLNVEDLPTYEKMRDGEKWGAFSSRKEQDRSSTEATTYGNWSRNELMARQCALHYTSAGDLSNVRCMTGHSIEDISNMDDDEFLNFYLSASPSNTSTSRDANRMQQQETGVKRVKNLRKSVASLASLISPGKPGKKMQRSSSFKESSGSAVKPYRPPGQKNGSGSSGSGVLASYCPPGTRGKSKTKNRRSQLWCETFDRSGLADVELKRQEAIYELYQGERVMVDDLKMAKQTYRDSMVTLKMLTEEEVSRIFGKLDCLLPLHEDLLARLEKTRTKDGKTDGVGDVFIEWFPTLSPYNEYCANQADAKETLDNVVSREARVRDFLQRCLESPFSRKLNLWSYLDLPRSRLVKYPLLLKAIHKATPPDHKDASLLQQAIDVINNIIARVDELTGERQAKFVKSKLEYLDDKKRYPEVDISKKIICSGQLKSNRGPKLQVFLFDHALVLTRNATRGEKLTYQIYRHPVPLKTLVVETEEGGKLNGSFRGGLLSSDKAKYSFRVKSEEMNVSYTLIATDEHDKKQWVNAIQEAVNNCRLVGDECALIRTPVPRRGASQKVKSSDSKVDTASVKRTSSMKSDSGTSSPWFRSRSMTLTGGRRSGKEKKESGDSLKKSKPSPAPIRRHSKPSVFEHLPEPDFLSRNSLDDKSDWERSRSLTSSPIAFLTHLPKTKRQPRNGSGLGRSESCYTKPPKGLVASFVRQYSARASGKTPPRSPVISSARSVTDLPSYERRRSNSEHSLNVEAIRNRLALVESRSSSTLSESVTEENFPSSHSSKDTESSSTSPLDSQSNIASPRRLSSRTCPCDPSDAYDVATSTPIHASCSSPNILQSVRIPTIAWVPSDEDARSVSKRVSSCSSASSLADLPAGIDDVDTILDNAAGCKDDGFHSDDVKKNIANDVIDTLTDVLNRVCKTTSPTRPVLPHPRLTVTCSDHYITITSDEGISWPCNDVEMTI